MYGQMKLTRIFLYLIFGGIGALFLAACFFTGYAEVETTKDTKFPHLSADNLNGKSFKFPDDFSSKKTLILFAYQHDQADALNSWVEGLDLMNSEIPWFEMPVISKPYIAGSFIIDGGMRRGIRNAELRDHVVTLYTSRENFSKSLGIPYDIDGVYAMVINKTGHNTGYIKGTYDPERGILIKQMLSEE